MSDLLRKAFLGWQDFTGAGKLAALLLLVLFLLWILKLGRGPRKRLWFYSLVMTVLCIVPVTAVCLMLYQTKFYDYQWIWTLVPMTAMISCGGCLLWQWVQDKKELGKMQKIVLLLAALCVVLLCGRLGNPKWTVKDTRIQRAEIGQVLRAVKGDASETICLWAPKEVMEQARSLDGDITLVYGRNMWQAHMNAFAYDTYTLEQTRMFAWMEMAPIYGSVEVPAEQGHAAVFADEPEQGEILDGLACADEALALGANRILLPGTMFAEAVEAFEQHLGTKAQRVGAYYLLQINHN